MDRGRKPVLGHHHRRHVGRALGPVPGSATVQAVLLVLSAAALAGAVALRLLSPLFLLPVAWAPIGLVVRNTLTTPGPIVAGVAGATLLALLLVRPGWSGGGRAQSMPPA